MGPFLSLLAFYLLFTSLWCFSVLHFIWFVVSMNSSPTLLSAQGGRHSQGMRHWIVWKHLRDYFPTKLVKSAELAPNGNYLLVAHHHGTTSIRTFCNFCTESTGFSRLFPGLRPWTTFYKPPETGFYPVPPRLGQAVVVLVRGEHEALHAIPGEHCLTLWNRKGFVRLALRHSVPLVPVYSFGENEAFTVKPPAPDSWQHLFQTTFKKLMYFSPCILWGRCLLRPVPGPVGRPIPVPQCPQPTEEQVDHYHVFYMKALEQLFEE
ncbi:hypothetical protein FD754_023750, partial [Muntiacus muntjak]